MSNPNTDIVIMLALAQILPVGTNLLAQHPIIPPAVIGPTVYIQDRFAMSQGGFPALQLYAGTQTYIRNSTSTYEGIIVVKCEYADRWDTQANTIKTIRDTVAADLEIMKHNVSRNESLTIGLINYGVSVPKITLSPYEGSIETTGPGVAYIYRTMDITINILPYDEL